jgi:hypothetical protein
MDCGKLDLSPVPRFCRHMGDKPPCDITPEMIEAGLEAISGFELLDAWEGHLSRRDLLEDVYRRMDKAAPRKL